MKFFNQFAHFTSSAALVFALGTTSLVQADDTEIYLNSSSSTGSANILFSLDTSGSMGSRVDENNDGVIDSATERRRIDVLKEAMGIVLDSLPSLNAGLQRYHYYGGPILYPVAALEQEACVVEGNCTTGTATTGTVNVTTTLAGTADDAEQIGSALLGTVDTDRVALDVGERPAGSCSTVIGSVRISSSLDDAESDISEPTDTEYEPYSSDLEIPREGSEQQMIGLRFQNVPIPAGANVTSASIEFIIDNNPSGYNSPIDVLIAGETITTPQLGAFNNSGGSNEPEDRVVNSTAAIVNWETGEFPSVGDPLETNNIAAILNEMLGDADWNSGDDMTFFLYKDPSASSGDNGSREVESYDGSSSRAPLLKYSYESCTSLVAEEIRTGLRFDGVSIPQGSTITSARIDFTASTAETGAGTFQVRVEDADDASAFVDGTSAPFGARTFVSGPVAWDATTTPILDNPWVVDTAYSTPDLTTAVQAVVNRAGWCGGNALMFMIERNGGANVLRTAYSSEGDSSKAPTLTITYDADTPQTGANGCTQSTIVKNITSGNNDAEEASDGSVNVSSSDLELVQEATTQTVGVRFTDIPIAQGTTIADAKLIFTADETHSGATSLTFHGELSEDSLSFSNSTNDITDTSGRPRTSASRTWSPPAFAAVGQISAVDGIGPLVQEIVNQGGWEPGNAMTFFVSGSGKRVADSYDGNPATAPRLEITFQGTPVSSKKTVRSKLKDLVEGLVQASGTPISGVMTEAAYYFRGEGVRFGRQRGTQASQYRVSNVSHAASYNANGSTVTYPGSCAADNEAHADCATQVISGGTPTYKSPIIAECQSNYLVQLTDGGGYYTGSGKTNTLGQSIDERSLINAFTAHDENGNTVTMPACDTPTTLSDGTSTYSGGSHNECTVKLAKFLHENDQIFSAGQALQSGTSPIDGVQTLDIYNIGFNLCGSGNITSLSSSGEQVCCAAGGEVGGVCSSPLTDPDRIRVLKAQADVAGGKYFNANTVDELVAAFTAITSDIVQKASTFAAPAVSVNTFNRLFSRDEIYFGLFEPSRDQRWKGNLKKYKLCVRADIDGDGTDDCTLGDILDDNLTSAVVNDSAAADDGLFKESARSVWSSEVDGREIDKGGAGSEITDYTGRTIYTDVNTAVGQATNGTALSASGYTVDSSNWDATATSAVRDQVCPDPSVITTGSDCEARMLWMLGFDQFNEDEDTSTNTRWWFNDVLHSSPTAITYGKTTGDAFIDKVLVGTNEGGLHFINGATGEEEWVFMPNAVLPMQQSLYDNSASAHTYGLDATPVVGINDVNRDGTIDPATDFVGVIIAQRRGGDNMYALDLTPTATLTSTTTPVVPKFMWQISSSTTGYGRLGQTWSEPVIAEIATPSGPKEVMIFGGGYDTDLDDDDGSGNARKFGAEAGNPQQGNAIFVADPTDGSLIFSISGPSSGADIEVTDMVHAIPSNVTVFDSDGDGLDDRIYVGDVGGNIWRVDLSGVNPASATAPEGASVVGKLASMSTAGTLADERRFFYKPAVVQVIDKVYSDAAGGEFDYVLIGSGNRANPLDTEVNDRFYAIRDINTGKMADSDNNNIADSYPLVVAGTSKGSPIGNGDLTDVTSNVLDPSTSGSTLGWYVNFDSMTTDGEKVLASSTVIAGTLFFTTYVPDDPTAIADTCSAAEGSSRVYGLNVLAARAALDWDEDGSVTTSGGASAADASIEVTGGGISSGVTPVLTEDGDITALADQQNLGPLADRPRARTYWNEVK